MIKWFKLFDEDRDGKISLEEFCEVLGLRIEEVRETHVGQQQSAAKLQIDSRIQVLSANMELAVQVSITDECLRLFDQLDIFSGQADIKVATRSLKKYLDNRFSRMWHVVVLTGSFWMNYSHDDNYAIQFKCGRYVVLAWRTPQASTEA
ncbi:unnamed protein product [Protopolystoma xenopodis]|uniref:EF-hand domain-containing protein n=1 Tax=Protopolystoma xenopodis TaxID=117903 RepID=A0A3S5C3G6_9PLAT|nr:unnamed protein product [Protopolystoma xenopodis]